GVLTKEMVKKMAKDPVVFAMSNPVPEISVADAKEAGVAVMATGRSDYPNQINNVLAFPGIFRGALDVNASDINEEMKIAAAHAIAGIVTDADRSADYIIPDSFNPMVTKAVAEAVAEAARKTGVTRSF
ncbi:MAG: NAD-dependent malic enzyme, partial [Lachnospiraceae bacterium]|nr:NAD-dependent malic enzyme [Lachnospiraceae bacterium]